MLPWINVSIQRLEALALACPTNRSRGPCLATAAARADNGSRGAASLAAMCDETAFVGASWAHLLFSFTQSTSSILPPGGRQRLACRHQVRASGPIFSVVWHAKPHAFSGFLLSAVAINRTNSLGQVGRAGPAD